jgi:hypothetical protein
MSSIIKFFVARDDAAAAAVAVDGPPSTLEPAEYGNFDVFSTIEEWQSILTDRDLEEVIAEGGPDVVSGDDEPIVLLVPPRSRRRSPTRTRTPSAGPPSGGSRYGPRRTRPSTRSWPTT